MTQQELETVLDLNKQLQNMMRLHEHLIRNKAKHYAFQIEDMLVHHTANFDMGTACSCLMVDSLIAASKHRVTELQHEIETFKTA